MEDNRAPQREWDLRDVFKVKQETDPSKIDTSWYALSLIIPLLGFFAGATCLAKSKFGPGAALIVLGFLGTFITGPIVILALLAA